MHRSKSRGGADWAAAVIEDYLDDITVDLDHVDAAMDDSIVQREPEFMEKAGQQLMVSASAASVISSGILTFSVDSLPAPPPLHSAVDSFGWAKRGVGRFNTSFDAHFNGNHSLADTIVSSTQQRRITMSTMYSGIATPEYAGHMFCHQLKHMFGCDIDIQPLSSFDVNPKCREELQVGS